MNTKLALAIAGTALGSGAAGYAAGVLLTRKKFDHQIDSALENLQAQFDEEVARIRAEYNEQFKDVSAVDHAAKLGYGDPSDSKFVSSDLEPGDEETANEHELHVELPKDERVVFSTTGPIKTVNVLEQDKEGKFVHDESDQLTEWDKEFAARDESKPYVISQQEFYTGVDVDDFEASSLTFYEGDGELADEHDIVIPQGVVEEKIGHVNLSKFGIGSDDSGIVYIRNEEAKEVYEITRHEGKYSVVVAGMPDEDEPKRAKPRKMREADGN